LGGGKICLECGVVRKKGQYIRIKTKKEKKKKPTSSQESWNPSMLLTGAVHELILACCPSQNTLHPRGKKGQLPGQSKS